MSTNFQARMLAVGAATALAALFVSPVSAQTYTRSPLIRIFTMEAGPAPCFREYFVFTAQSSSVTLGFQCTFEFTQYCSSPIDSLRLEALNPTQLVVADEFNVRGDWVSFGGACDSQLPGVLDFGYPDYPIPGIVERTFVGLEPGRQYQFSWRACYQRLNQYVGYAVFFRQLPPPDPDWSEVVACPLWSIDTACSWSWQDFDSDGLEDLFRLKGGDLASYSGPFTLYALRNAGSGALVSSGIQAPAIGELGDYRDPIAPTVSWADADADGDLDGVYGGRGIGLLLNQSNSSMSYLGLSLGDGNAVWVDFDRDGVLDLSVAGDGLARLHRGLGGGAFGPAIPVADGAFQGQAWGDLDADGWPDLYLCSPTSGDMLFRNEGGSLSQEMPLPPGFYGESYGSRCASWGDFDRDGDLDLMCSSDGMQGNRLLRNSPLGLEPSGIETFRCLSTGGSAIWGDVDNDGWLDLLLGSRSEGGAHRLFRNLSGTGFEDITPSGLPGLGSGQCGGLADVDRDGDLDLGIGIAGIRYYSLYQLENHEWDHDHVFRNNIPGQGHWLRVELEGVQSNRSAIGARVTVWAGGAPRVREISAGDGWSQPPLACHFGLGSATVADSVVIRWPSGQRQAFLQVPADLRVRFTEGSPDGTVGVAPAGAAAHLSLDAFPNPSRASTSIHYALPRAARVTLEVLDVAGRRVRTLVEGSFEPGSQRAQWNGTDAAGRRVAAGVYFLQLRAGAESRRVPVIRTR